MFSCASVLNELLFSLLMVCTLFKGSNALTKDNFWRLIIEIKHHYYILSKNNELMDRNIWIYFSLHRDFVHRRNGSFVNSCCFELSNIKYIIKENILLFWPITYLLSFLLHLYTWIRNSICKCLLPLKEYYNWIRTMICFTNSFSIGE